MRLHRNVERADRLVGDDQLRPGNQGAGDRDTLPLPSGEFVREFVHVRVAQPDLSQHRGDPLAQAGAIHPPQRRERFGDDARNRLPRIQRSIRILKHHLDIPPGAAKLVCGHPMQITAQQ